MTLRDIKTVIVEMLTEDTGKSMLDSGGCCGRMYQRNQLIESFADRPEAIVEVYGHGTDGELMISYDTYHYLTNHLEITAMSEQMNAGLDAIINTDKNDSYPEDVAEFIANAKKYGVDKTGDGTNTYNYDNILSQVLQYDIIEYEGDHYIILQIHGGADVRGGYTRPQVFKIGDRDYFIIAQFDISAICECSQWTSDDSGAHWYYDGSTGHDQPAWLHDEENQKVLCPDCKGEVTFQVLTDW